MQSIKNSPNFLTKKKKDNELLDVCVLFLSLGGKKKPTHTLFLFCFSVKCVSAELTTLAELLTKVEPETRSVCSKEDPDALGCLTRLQDCLGALQPLLTSSIKRLAGRQGLQTHHQVGYTFFKFFLLPFIKATFK